MKDVTMSVGEPDTILVNVNITGAGMDWEEIVDDVSGDATDGRIVATTTLDVPCIIEVNDRTVASRVEKTEAVGDTTGSVLNVVWIDVGTLDADEIGAGDQTFSVSDAAIGTD